MAQPAAVDESNQLVTCWCCGNEFPEASVVRLGRHPEACVCLGCARYLHLKANARRDAQHPSLASRGRDVLRSGRTLVIRRGWHQRPLIGRPLRWLGRHLP